MTIFLKRFLPALFFATMLAYILAGIWQNQPWQLVTKPLLMPLLMWWVWLKAVPTKNRTLILVALFFSLAGDVFLLLEYKEPFLFIPGLVSFLLTHFVHRVLSLATRQQEYITKNCPVHRFIGNRLWICVGVFFISFPGSSENTGAHLCHHYNEHVARKHSYLL